MFDNNKKIVRVWNTISTDSMCLKFKAEHAEDNIHSESLLPETKNQEKYFNDVTIGNTAVAISRVAMKQSVRRELH